MLDLDKLTPREPKNAKGKETIESIIVVATDVLCDEGSANFTIRNIANKAGLYLRNVQYYFPSRESLIKAVFDRAMSRYNNRLNLAVKGLHSDPKKCLMAYVDLYLDDNIHNDRQRKFSVQIMSLLYSIDNYEGSYLKQLYADKFIDRFINVLQEIDPKAKPAEIHHRSQMIASLIDGVYFFGGSFGSDRKEVEKYCERLRDEVSRIALADG